MSDHELPDDWSESWRQETPPELAGLRRQVRRARWRQRLALILELAVGAGGAAAGVWLILTGAPWVGAAAILFGSFGIGVSLLTRRDRGSHDTSTVTQALDAALAEARRQRRVTMGGLWLCVAALVFLAVVGLASGSTAADSFRGLGRLVRMQGLGALFVAAVLAFVTVSLMRSSRRLAGLRALRLRLGADPAEAEQGLDR